MEITNIVETVMTQGVFCILFVYFYLDNNKKNAEREERYIERENKYIEQLRQSGEREKESAEREKEYQKIINDYNTRIINQLDKIEDKLTNK